MVDRHQKRGGANWLLWLVVGIIIVAVLLLLVPALFAGDDGVDADDEIVEDEEQTRAPSFTIDDTARLTPQIQLADGSYIVVTL